MTRTRLQHPVAGPDGSEDKPEREAEVPLVGPRAGHGHEVAETADGYVRVEPHVRDVRARVIEVRRVGHVERLGAELQTQPFGNWEGAEEGDVRVDDSGPAEDVAAAGSIAYVGDSAERERVEEGDIAPDAAQLFHGGLYLVGGLSVTRSIERRAIGADAKRRARVGAEGAVCLPVAHEPRRWTSAGGEPLTGSEGEVCSPAQLQHMAAVVPRECAVAPEHIVGVPGEPGPAVFVGRAD